ncbi:MAG TPA: alpha-ribazole phosphatase [Clostridiales bacterium]|nr:alpha-ribazole phosphatase [Clostridiales bacterium]
MMTRIYLARHGETLLNRKGLYFGSTDCALSPEGEKQARVLGEKLKHLCFHRIITSPLQRSIRTMDIALAPGLPREIEPDLREMDFGAWEALAREEIQREWPDAWDAWCRDWLDHSPPGGETGRQFHNRVTAAFDRLIRQYRDENLLIISHTGCMRSITTHALGLGAEASWRFRFDHDGLTGLDNADGYFVLSFLNR